MDKKLKTGILALLAVLCLMIVASFAYAQGAVAYFEATLGMGGSLGESGPLGSCGLEGEVCDETLACCEGLFCSPGIVYSALYYDDVVKHCCPSGTYWDNDESACVPSPAFSCSDGWTENFNSGIDVFNDWFRYYDSVDNYQTHTVYGMLYIDGFKEGDFSDYNWGMGGDYLKSRYYLGDGSDDEVLEFVWKMRLNPIGFEDFGKSNAIMYLQNEEEDYIINIWRTGHFPGDGQPHNIVILEGYNTGVGWDELCVDGNCCPSCIFRDLTMYDTYKLVIDVAEQKYQVYLNDVLFDNFNNPGHPTVHDWRYYQGPGRLEKLSVVFGGNTLFEQTQNVSFDDFSASGGTCADLDLGHRICGDVSASGTDLPSACDTDLTDVAVFPNMNYYNFYCVYEGKNYSSDLLPFTPEVLGPYGNMTCEINENVGLGSGEQRGIWCPVNFDFDEDLQKCVPGFTSCDYGFVPKPGLLYGCDAPFKPNTGTYPYNTYCFNDDGITQPWEEQPPYSVACCFFTDFQSYNFYQFAPVEVYNPS